MSLLQRLSFNQMTTDPWPIERVIRNCSKSGIPYIGVWRHKLDGDTAKVSAVIRREGLRVASLCRGGGFSGPPPQVPCTADGDKPRLLADGAGLLAPGAVSGAGLLHGRNPWCMS